MLHYVTLRCITSHYVTLRHITSHYVTLRYITLHYVTLRYITLHYMLTSSDWAWPFLPYIKVFFNPGYAPNRLGLLWTSNTIIATCLDGRWTAWFNFNFKVTCWRLSASGKLPDSIAGTAAVWLKRGQGQQLLGQQQQQLLLLQQQVRHGDKKADRSRTYNMPPVCLRIESNSNKIVRMSSLKDNQSLIGRSLPRLNYIHPRHTSMRYVT